jgi:WD40 repeat protein
MHGRPNDVLRGIAISPDGKVLAVLAGANGVLFFDARTYAQIGHPLAIKDSGEASLAYSPDGRTLAVGGDHILVLIDARTHEQLAKTAVDGVALRMAFTKAGSRLVVLVAPAISAQGLGDASAWITIRDAATLEPIGRSIEPEAFVGAYVGTWYASPQFAVTPDDRSLMTASEDGELARWDLRSRRRTGTWRIETGLAPALALSPDGLTAAVGIKRGVQLVDLRAGTVRTAASDLAGSPNWLLFSPDGKMVVATNRDKTVTRWDVASATPLETLRGHSNFVQQPVFSLDGATLYTVSHDDTAIAWDLTGDRRLGRPFTFTHDRTFSTTGFDGHPGRLSPDGRLIAVGLKEQGIALWDARELTPVGVPLLDTGGEVKSLAFSPDGQTLAAVTQHLLTLWDVGSRSRLREPLYAGNPSMVLAVGFSPDGATLATASSDLGLKFWDPATGDNLDVLGFAGSASDVAFSADGAMIASVPGQGGAEVWDVARTTSIATFDGTPGNEDTSVALSPDGHFLAVGGFGRVVRVWDVRNRKLVHELDQGGNGAFTLEFSPDGRTLAISGFEPVASLWDVATGTQIGPQLTAGDRRTMIDLSSDGRLLLEIHGNGRGAVWDVDPESWKRRACDLANRTLTREEWEEFLPGRPYEPACAT